MRILLSMVALLIIAPLAAGGDVVVIVHPNVAADRLHRQQVLDIYAGELAYWKDDTPITVCDLKRKNPTKLTFYRYLGKTTSQMKSLWMKKLLLGEREPPTTADSEEQILDFVAQTPGAIGYIDAAHLDDRVKRLTTIDSDH